MIGFESPKADHAVCDQDGRSNRILLLGLTFSLNSTLVKSQPSSPRCGDRLFESKAMIDLAGRQMQSEEIFPLDSVLLER
jgi:hypothetical protein